jgi:ATP-binding cassette subfamily C protein
VRLRVAGAEARAFAVWAERFAQQRRWAYQTRTISNSLAVFNAAFPTLALISVFGVIAASPTKPSTGAVLAMVAAFGGLLAALSSLSVNALMVVRVMPLLENIRPILETPPEVKPEKIHPGQLNGVVEVRQVTFRYTVHGPIILDTVSVEAKPGELIALVGPSGSGKSTLLRLLLGFETPASGAIYYDDQDLAELDLSALRRQIGVVLQNSTLLPGDIFSNIVGASALPLEAAWEAARRAGLEADIRQLPMGMHTIISEGGKTFSAGQRQRLMIARAIVNRPRLLFLDEATSALDNPTQASVVQGLETLQATRIVIAHRLSTVMRADRLYVFERGRVVQSGTYAELAEAAGPFRDLIRRQTV